ncbi:MAG: hypothetical protein KKD29_01395 [Candidatus Omnitrophica bacterium]|nr:hypothetical protein [Candidatus Omnitrophota bacterium]MBU4488298.1 hypothetical protein [Candidatus Omnitrophota bacterium]MCG2704486.1 hypothetical protein [Candidatus Omnitrophota bacterium]
MIRSIIILFLIVMISLMLFKVFAQNDGVEDADDISRILANQQLIIEKLEVIDSKVNILKTRIR